MTAAPTPRCPWCHTARRVYPHGEREWWCSGCKRLFDSDPDEGDDYSDHNPAARIERTERNRHNPRRARR